MTEQRLDSSRWHAPVLAAGFVLLIASVGGAADRVVLGEYFTNLF